MKYSGIIKRLSDRFGHCYQNERFYESVQTCLSWYNSEKQDIHKRVVSNGIETFATELYSLNMAKRVAEDWASSVLNEEYAITVNSGNKRSSIFLQGDKGESGVLGSNSFAELLPSALELMFALGTSAIVLGLDGVTVSEDGSLVKNATARITLTQYTALQIYPITYTNRNVKDVAFITEFVYKNKQYALVSSHILEEDGYVIYNEVMTLTGEPVAGDFGILPLLRTKSFKPLFCLLRTNIVNNLDFASPMGISVYANALDNLKACDVTYDSCVRDVVSGQRLVIMHKNLLTQDENGRTIAPQDAKRSYMQFVGDDVANSDVGNLIKEFNPTLNTDALNKEMQNQLNLLSEACGLGTKFYNFDIMGGVTATEYIGERNDFFKNANKMSKAVASALRSLFNQVLYLGYYAIGANVDVNAQIVVSLSDGVIESDKEIREQDRQDVKDGLMSAVEYRMKHYNETEEDAVAALAKIKKERSSGEV